MKSLISQFIVLCLLGIGAPLLHAQSGGTYDLSWSKIAGGGGTSSGGNYVISGTIGQSAAGKISGGNYSIHGGFWSLLAIAQTPGAPHLSILRTGESVIVSWPETTGSFTLEENSDLSSTNAWNAVALTRSTNAGIVSVEIPLPTGSRFFRLKE